jgi:hypothetical protein
MNLGRHYWLEKEIIGFIDLKYMGALIRSWRSLQLDILQEIYLGVG